ncbi:hypothetical protein CVT25_015317 [Psilocybe cyanescens]|uniref:GST C-terminal domain-containing protein n=1 Tax=Psilocybe cyanescens TaxID=93625 RepID=A0A409WH20_PSICY|nr:hypothetical protein CVT25_015317 [Psilocybe cyanescens]
MTITFYDIPSNTPECAWSPNTWKIRYALNYRNIPYKTEWIEYPDIEAHCIKFGIKPTGKLKSKRPTTISSGVESTVTVEKDYYSLPAIYDPHTNTYLANSLPIAEYLEATYPPSASSPSLFPDKTHGLQVAFTTAYNLTTQDDGVAEFIIPAIYPRLNDASHAYFRRTREERFGGRRLEDVVPRPGSEEERANWGKFKEVTGVLEEWYAKTDDGERRTPFLMGDTLSWADLVVAGYTIWLRIIWGEDNAKWQEMMTWHGGRWKTLIESLKKYETVV